MEYGFPSLHTSAGLFFALVTVSGAARAQHSMCLLLLVGFFWCNELIWAPCYPLIPDPQHQVHTLIERGVIAPATTLQHCLAYLPAAVWGVWIGLTRIYLGVHSPMDLLLGGYAASETSALFYKLCVARSRWMRRLGLTPLHGIALQG